MVQGHIATVYPYFEFNIYSFNIFLIRIFWANLFPKSEVLQNNWNLIQMFIAIMLITILTFIYLVHGYIAIRLITTLIFIFANFFYCSCNLGKLGGWIAICLLWFKCLFFQKNFHSYFLGRFGPKIWSFPNWLKFCAEVHSYMLITILMFLTNNQGHIVIWLLRF